jgi:ribose/xylose/arabinose/galactoside ABC-type transport system permease subunit
LYDNVFLGITAVGMTFVIIAGQIDLSVASTLALSGMAAALAMAHLANFWFVGALAGLGTGALVGLINGTLTTRLAIPSFLVTLGTLSAARGLAMMVTDTKPVIITNERYFRIFGEGNLFGLPAPIAWTLAATIGGVLLLHYNIFGRRIYAAGGNPTAALYSGIQIKRVTTWAFVLTGALAGLAALILSARSHAARPDVVQGMELDVIASVILGGCSLFGGRGFILGTLLGSLISERSTTDLFSGRSRRCSSSSRARSSRRRRLHETLARQKRALGACCRPQIKRRLEERPRVPMKFSTCQICACVWRRCGRACVSIVRRLARPASCVKGVDLRRWGRLDRGARPAWREGGLRDELKLSDADAEKVKQATLRSASRCRPSISTGRNCRCRASPTRSRNTASRSRESHRRIPGRQTDCGH